jgi:hypothetical protein
MIEKGAYAYPYQKMSHDSKVFHCFLEVKQYSHLAYGKKRGEHNRKHMVPKIVLGSSRKIEVYAMYIWYCS